MCLDPKSPLKRCNSCFEYLPLDEFHRDKRKSDGRQNRCKDCIFTYKRNQKAKGEIIEKEEHFIPDIYLVGFGEKQMYQHSCLSCEKPFFCLDINRNLEDLFCESCQFDESLLQERNISNIHHLGNIIGWIVKADGSFKRRSKKNYKKVYERDAYTCQYCGFNLEEAVEFKALHIDHIKPWAVRGGNSLNNLVVACETCNLIASDKWFDNFMDKKEFILQELERKR